MSEIQSNDNEKKLAQIVAGINKLLDSIPEQTEEKIAEEVANAIPKGIKKGFDDAAKSKLTADADDFIEIDTEDYQAETADKVADATHRSVKEGINKAQKKQSKVKIQQDVEVETDAKKTQQEYERLMNKIYKMKSKYSKQTLTSSEYDEIESKFKDIAAQIEALGKSSQNAYKNFKSLKDSLKITPNDGEWVRRESGLNGSSVDAYTVAKNAVTDIKVNKSLDVDGNLVQTEQRIVNFDKLKSEILRLDKEIYETEQQIKNTVDGSTEGLQNNLTLKKNELAVFEQIRAEELADQNGVYGQAQDKVLQTEQEVQRVKLENKQLDIDRNRLAKDYAAASKEASQRSIFESKQNTAKIELNRYINEMNSLGVEADETKVSVDQLYKLLNQSTFDTGLTEYNAKLQEFQTSNKEALDLARQEEKEREKTAKAAESQFERQAAAAEKAAQREIAAAQKVAEQEAKQIRKEAQTVSDLQTENASKAYKKASSDLKDYYELKIKYQQQGEKLNKTEVNDLARLEQKMDEARRGIGEYTEALDASQRARNAFNNAQGGFDEKINELAREYANELENIEEKLHDLASSGKYTDKLTTDMNELAKTIHQINGEEIDLNAEKTIKQIAEIRNKSQDLFDKASLADYRKAAEDTLSKIGAKLEKLAHDNSAMGAKLRKEWGKIKVDLQTAESQQKVKDLVKQMANLEAQIYKANQAGKSFAAQFSERLRSTITGQVAQYFSFNDIIRYGREAAGIVKDYNSALTEMRKVSDESVESLLNYQSASFDVADSVGTTALQLQNSTADWLRLGESMEEAAQSAKDATVLLNVSEFESIDEATQALVSASQAYKELDKMEIIDVLNNIGKNECRNIW